jgi:flagellar hook-associated protein 1 FlgK
MGGLFSSLQTASTALDAISQALGVSQSNIANASTPGYAAQSASILPIGIAATGGSGDDFVDITSSGNAFSDATVRAASSQASASSTQAVQLGPINQLFDITGASGILAAFQQFSTAFSNLSVTPNDPTVGAEALTAAGGVASAFQSVAANLDSQSTLLNSSIQNTTATINTLSAAIGQLNVQTIASSASGQVNATTDASLRSDLDQLSTLVDITVTTAPDGAVSVLAGGTLPLVIGSQSYTLSTNPAAAPGSQVSSSAGGNSPVSFSGQLGALLQTQNDTIAPLLGGNGQTGSLNTLAAGFASLVNTLLSSGTTEASTPAAPIPGVPIFTYDQVNPTDAARSLTLDPAVTPDQLGLASVGPPPQSNGVANSLAALASSSAPANQIAGLSAEGLFSSIAQSVGQQLSDANTNSTTDQNALTAAQASRQQQSGVSLDQEAVNITDDQRSYEANAQVVSILNQLTEDEVNMTIPSTG